MPKQFDLLVFDWDGTLMDSTGTIARAIQAAFSDIGLPIPSDKEARYVIGYGMNEAMQYNTLRLMPRLPKSPRW